MLLRFKSPMIAMWLYFFSHSFLSVLSSFPLFLSLDSPPLYMLPHRGGSVLFPQIWLLHSLWHPHVDVILYSYTPHSMKLGILISPCPSVSPSLRPSVGRIMSTLYLLQYLPELYHIYTSYQATSDVVLRIKFLKKICSFGKVFKFIALTLSCFDLGFNMNWSVVWVIMGWRGYPQNAGVLVVLITGINPEAVWWGEDHYDHPLCPGLQPGPPSQTPGGLGWRCWSVSGVTWPPNLEFRRWGSSGPSSLM